MVSGLGKCPLDAESSAADPPEVNLGRVRRVGVRTDSLLWAPAPPSRIRTQPSRKTRAHNFSLWKRKTGRPLEKESGKIDPMVATSLQMEQMQNTWIGP